MTRAVLISCVLLSVGASPSGIAAADEKSALDQVADRTIESYTLRLEEATRELEATAARIAAQKGPALDRIQKAESAILSLQSEVASLQEAEAQADERARQLEKENQALMKTVGYLHNLAYDVLRTTKAGLSQGENELTFATLQQEFDARPAEAAQPAAVVFRAALERIETQLGGHAANGRAVNAHNHRVTEGMFAFFGPETIFISKDGPLVGTVMAREGSPYPVVHPLPKWNAVDSLPLLEGAEAMVYFDATGGKALRLQQTTGTFWEHVKRGGVMAFVILATGLIATVLAVHKLWEFRSLQLDPPAVMSAAFEQIVRATPEEAERVGRTLHGTTRGLFLAGARSLSQSKDVIEEELYAFTVGQRLHYEKRLPLLAVIATAAPLMGLLGTVMGMVKTFALITVFGTGNAAKLSSGISEILVTTELGLAVAIPALVIHGFLTHSIQKKLSQLERHAVEFLSVVSQARSGREVMGGLPS